MELFFKYKLDTIFDSIFHNESWVINRIQGFGAQRIVSNNLKTSARFWHRDSVGRRFKIWFPIQIKKYAPKTELIVTSHLQDPIPRKWEMLRSDLNIIKSPIFLKLSKIIQSHRCYKKLDFKNKNITILDTNSIHRGDYMADKYTGESLRLYLEISLRGKETGNIFDALNGVNNPNLDVSDKYKRFCCSKHFKKVAS